MYKPSEIRIIIRNCKSRTDLNKTATIIGIYRKTFPLDVLKFIKSQLNQKWNIL